MDVSFKNSEKGGYSETFKGETYEKFFSIDFARDRKFEPNKQFYEGKSTCERFSGTPDFLKNFLHQGYYLVVFRVFE